MSFYANSDDVKEKTRVQREFSLKMADINKPKKQRKPRIKNFTQVEDAVLVPFMLKEYELLFGTLGQGGCTLSKRLALQRKIQEAVNA